MSSFVIILTYRYEGIITDRRRGNDPEWEKNEDVRLNPESIAKVCLSILLSAFPDLRRCSVPVIFVLGRPGSFCLDLGA